MEPTPDHGEQSYRGSARLKGKKTLITGADSGIGKTVAIAIDVLGDDGLASVQNQFSPRYATSFDELRYCDERGIAFMPWSPLGGIARAPQLGDRFAVFSEIAAERNVSRFLVVLAWELALGEHVIVIPGARRAESIRGSALAGALQLTPRGIDRCNEAVGIEAG